MRVNISYTEVPLEYQELHWNTSKLKDNMWMSKENFRTISVEFKDLIGLVKSDYRQVTPFEYKDGIKLSENWSNNNQNLVILDVDDGISILDIMSRFDHLEYLIYTTKSHQVEKSGKVCDRFRIIFPAINVPTGEEYFEFTRSLEERLPFIDKQVNTKTGAFLGNFNCKYYYNSGLPFDCNRYKKIVIIKHVEPPRRNYNPLLDSKVEIDVERLKSQLSRERVADIINSLGYEVNNKFMFRHRSDDRTPSASISSELYIKDFGSDLGTDIIGFVMDEKRCGFKEALTYIEEH